MKKVILGKTGLSVSVCGFGVLPMGPAQLALPVSEGAAIIRHALDHGINFLDTAQYYKTYPYIKEALAGGADGSDESAGSAGESADGSAGAYGDVVICSKSLESDYDGMMEAIHEAREAMGRDVIDIFLMHEVRSGQLIERAGAWQALVDAREAGLVRAIGLSTHHVDVTAAAAFIEDLDVVFPLINYAGLGIRRGSEFATATEMMDAIQLCHDAGKGVFSMKAFGGGALTANYQEALDYVFGASAIDSVMVGFGKISDVDDILSYLDGTMAADYQPDAEIMATPMPTTFPLAR